MVCLRCYNAGFVSLVLDFCLCVRVGDYVLVWVACAWVFQCLRVPVVWRGWVYLFPGVFGFVDLVGVGLAWFLGLVRYVLA